MTRDLSLEAIATAVGVSRFHLSRAYSVAMGSPLMLYVRARRLSEAAKELAEGAPDILTVALNAGYGSHEAFSRAFRQQFGLTPEQVRAQANLESLHLQEPIRMNQPSVSPLAPPRIQQSDAFLICGFSQQYKCGQMAGIPAQWERFVPYLGHIPGQVGNVAYGVVYNSDEAGNFDYLCGVEIAEFRSLPQEFTRLRVAPQTYAVFEHRDHISSIASTWSYVWNQGLSDAGYKAVDGPVLERYGPEFDGRTGLGGLELLVPVQT